MIRGQKRPKQQSSVLQLLVPLTTVTTPSDSIEAANIDSADAPPAPTSQSLPSRSPSPLSPIPYPLPPSTIQHDLYPPPPSGPIRRIRELRLDLRALDTAALFALETWRRQLLELPKLGMAKPHSKYYQGWGDSDDDEGNGLGLKIGDSEGEGELDNEGGVKPVLGEASEEVDGDGEVSGVDKVQNKKVRKPKNRPSQVPATVGTEGVDGNGDVSGSENQTIDPSIIIEAITNAEISAVPTESHDGPAIALDSRTDPIDQTNLHPILLPNNTDSTKLTDLEHENSDCSTRLSPDILLPDAYNEDDDDDPDFVPQNET